MSQENIRTLMRGYEVFNQGDTPPISELAREIGTPDVEWGAVGAFPGVEGLYRGPEAIAEWMDIIRSEWEEFEVTLDKVLASGRESPISPSHLRNGSGRASPGPRVAIMRTRVG
jgi:hypothetical protein